MATGPPDKSMVESPREPYGGGGAAAEIDDDRGTALGGCGEEALSGSGGATNPRPKS